MGAEGEELADDWCVEGSDDEKYTSSADKRLKGDWIPDPEEIKSLYEKLAKGESLEIEWKLGPLGRRGPDDERIAAEKQRAIVAKRAAAVAQAEERVVPTEFDFDEDLGEAVETKMTVTPRRTPGSARAKSQKRVASMDKIMNDMIRYKKMNEESKKDGTPHKGSPKGKVKHLQL